MELGSVLLEVSFEIDIMWYILSDQYVRKLVTVAFSCRSLERFYHYFVFTVVIWQQELQLNCEKSFQVALWEAFWDLHSGISPLKQ